MSAPESRDPVKVATADGAVWVRAAVTTTGQGLYAREGVEGCPRHVLATLAELAEHGVKAVASPGELAEQRHLVDPLDHVLEHLADERPAVTS